MLPDAGRKSWWKMSTETVLLIQKIIVYLTVPAALGFPIWYHFRMRWQRSEMGRHVMGYSSVVALLYFQAMVGIQWSTYPGQRYAGLLLALLMMIVIWWRVIVFVRIRRRTARETEERFKNLQKD